MSVEDGSYELRDGLLIVFSGDNGTRVKHQRPEGGFHGCWWLAMTCSRSRPKSSSSVTVELGCLASLRISAIGRPLR